jgi:PleD family two-component response regulator
MGIIRWVSFKKISRLSGGKMGKKTILVVDDAKENINILGELLKEDYNVRAAINGEKALVIAASENKPDLILLDVVMPGMDGHEVCKRLKADITTKDIPIIFITGKSDEKDELTGFEIGAVDYVTKPFNPVVVKARVKTHLDLKSNRDLLEEKNRELNKINYNITESIKYAKLIQESILPHTEVVLNENRFVIWRPRDLVGGDFYWHKKCNNGDFRFICTFA